MRGGVIAIALMGTAGCGRDAPSGTRGEPATATATAPSAASTVDDAADPWPRCRAIASQRLVDHQPLDAVTACRDLFPPACRDAMATLRAPITLDAGLAVVHRCADALCPQADQPLCGPASTLADAADHARALFATGLAAPTATADERGAIGLVLGTELLPMTSPTVRLTVARDGIHATIDGDPDAFPIGVHPTPASFDRLIARLRADGADASGILLWGLRDLAAADADRLSHALRAAAIEWVACTPSTCR